MSNLERSSDRGLGSAVVSRDITPLGAWRRLVQAFAFIGFGLIFLITTGLIHDVSQFDQTRGGYEAPYTGWTGTSIDWSVVDVTPDGFASRGSVVDVLVNCTTGMIEMEVLGLAFPFRGLSERAIAVHHPREACANEGFQVQF